ncbi:LCP family protein [Nakamurella sp.]|uniref:LCP family protein n=1 Tax=Nakamurella sp. TaxID=1869182 RepID=UPI00378482F0
MTPDVDDLPETAPPESPTRPRYRALRVAGRVLALVVAAAVVLASGVAWWAVDRVDSSIAQRSVDALAPDDPNIRTAPAAGGDTATAENILILGLDTRPADQVAPGEGTSQSDVMMIAHVSADRQRVDLVSIPRDLLIPAPTCKAWDYSTNSLSDRDFDNPYSQWKITNAFAVGGPACTVKAVQALTGLRIDRLVVVQFTGFASVVDAMGGLTMTFDGPVVDHGRTIIASGGTQLIDGDQALALARARRVAGDPTGDLGRIGRQQQLLAAMLAQVSSGGLITDPARLDRVLQTVIDNSATDNVTVADLMDLALSVKGNESSAIHDYTLPTVPDTDTDGLLAAATMPAYLEALVADRPLPGAAG